MPPQVDWETTSGAVNMILIHEYITNAYRNVSNVVVTITPKALPSGAKAVLLNAHYDNTLGSPGVCQLLMALKSRLAECLQRSTCIPH